MPPFSMAVEFISRLFGHDHDRFVRVRVTKIRDKSRMIMDTQRDPARA